ncbi:sulfotransferase domain-containing protein [Bacillus sp. Cs-700]|uniref:sulfotransferase domain-containing protein n=1 Tax=Bacillus sp. Cs-700 TaxID=2589818 RepID=UPI00140B6219|nr:sulfotransferase domain-containing protein [Bacillus sp. Cs-700]
MSQIVIPSFFLNSIPKSGTHLLKQLLLGIPGIQYNPHIGLYGHYHYQTDEKLHPIKNLPLHSFANGHLHYSVEWETFFKELKMKQVFVLRDPRDVLISYAHFIPGTQIDHLYRTFTQEGFTHRDRIKFLIEGGPVLENGMPDHPGIREWYQSFSGWLNRPNVHAIRFEDMIASEQMKRKTTGELLDFLSDGVDHSLHREDWITAMISNIRPEASVTFRKGKSGGWKDEMDDELKALFHARAGDLLEELGYE